MPVESNNNARSTLDNGQGRRDPPEDSTNPPQSAVATVAEPSLTVATVPRPGSGLTVAAAPNTYAHIPAARRESPQARFQVSGSGTTEQYRRHDDVVHIANYTVYNTYNNCNVCINNGLSRESFKRGINSESFPRPINREDFQRGTREPSVEKKCSDRANVLEIAAKAVDTDEVITSISSALSQASEITAVADIAEQEKEASKESPKSERNMENLLAIATKSTYDNDDVQLSRNIAAIQTTPAGVVTDKNDDRKAESPTAVGKEEATAQPGVEIKEKFAKPRPESDHDVTEPEIKRADTPNKEIATKVPESPECSPKLVKKTSSRSRIPERRGARQRSRSPERNHCDIGQDKHDTPAEFRASEDGKIPRSGDKKKEGEKNAKKSRIPRLNGKANIENLIAIATKSTYGNDDVQLSRSIASTQTTPAGVVTYKDGDRKAESPTAVGKEETTAQPGVEIKEKFAKPRPESDHDVTEPEMKRADTPNKEMSTKVPGSPECSPKLVKKTPSRSRIPERRGACQRSRSPERNHCDIGQDKQATPAEFRASEDDTMPRSGDKKTEGEKTAKKSRIPRLIRKAKPPTVTAELPQPKQNTTTIATPMRAVVRQDSKAAHPQKVVAKAKPGMVSKQVVKAPRKSAAQKAGPDLKGECMRLKRNTVAKREIKTIVKPEQKKDVPEPKKKAVPEPKKKDVQEPKKKAEPEPKKKAVPEPKKKDVPEHKKKAVPEPKKKAVPEPKKKAVPEPKKKAEPQKTEVKTTRKSVAQKKVVPEPKRKVVAKAEDKTPKQPIVKKDVRETKSNTAATAAAKLLRKPLPQKTKEGTFPRKTEVRPVLSKAEKKKQEEENVTQSLREAIWKLKPRKEVAITYGPNGKASTAKTTTPTVDSHRDNTGESIVTVKETEATKKVVRFKDDADRGHISASKSNTDLPDKLDKPAENSADVKAKNRKPDVDEHVATEECKKPADKTYHRRLTMEQHYKKVILNIKKADDLKDMIQMAMAELDLMVFEMAEGVCERDAVEKELDKRLNALLREFNFEISHQMAIAVMKSPDKFRLNPTGPGLRDVFSISPPLQRLAQGEMPSLHRKFPEEAEKPIPNTPRPPQKKKSETAYYRKIKVKNRKHLSEEEPDKSKVSIFNKMKCFVAGKLRIENNKTHTENNNIKVQPDVATEKLAGAPAGNDEMAGSPVGNEEMTGAPVGNEDMAGAPIGNEEMAGAPVGNEEMAGAPAGNEEMAGAPVGNEEMAGAPVGNEEMAGAPVGNEEMAGAPAGNEEMAGAPVGNEDMAGAPVGNEEMAGSPVGNEEMTGAPAGNEGMEKLSKYRIYEATVENHLRRGKAYSFDIMFSPQCIPKKLGKPNADMKYAEREINQNDRLNKLNNLMNDVCSNMSKDITQKLPVQYCSPNATEYGNISLPGVDDDPRPPWQHGLTTLPPIRLDVPGSVPTPTKLDINRTPLPPIPTPKKWSSPPGITWTPVPPLRLPDSPLPKSTAAIPDIIHVFADSSAEGFRNDFDAMLTKVEVANKLETKSPIGHVEVTGRTDADGAERKMGIHEAVENGQAPGRPPDTPTTKLDNTNTPVITRRSQA